MLPLRREITEGFQRQNNAMLVGAFALLAAKREEVEAGRAYIEAVRDYWVARARVEALMAGRMTEGSVGGAGNGERVAPARGDGH
jgi:cobalt-zinc-cadmium efflux system outer membrane protein